MKHAKHKPFAIAILPIIAFMLFLPAASVRAELPPAGVHVLELARDSDIMRFDGKEIRSVQPVVYVEGRVYVPLKSIAPMFGFKIGYDANTRETVVKSESLEFRFRDGSPVVKVNGTDVQAAGPSFIRNGYMMVPLRTWANLTGARIGMSGGGITLQWGVTGPIAAFEIGPEEIHAGQTQVVYTDRASHPMGLEIVQEIWEGRRDVFPEPGTYTVTRRVMDAEGRWSEPYSVTVKVLPPNLPPVADFTTDKQAYRIGEPVHYTDLSRDDENAIVRRTWTGNEQVFFEPGEKRIELEVEDRHGLTHRVSKTITILDEVLYTREEYYRLFTGIGEKYAISPGEALTFEPVEYQIEKGDMRLLKSNSPEFLKSVGVAYDTVQNGRVRLLIYNQSSMPHNVKMYLIATNVDSAAAEVAVGAHGVGGPATYSATAGKMSTVRYLDAVSRGVSGETVRIPPKESVVLLADKLSAAPLKPNQVISAYAEIQSNRTIRYRIVVVPEGVDPLKSLETLPVLDRDGVHVRGTFDYADRTITVAGQLGRTKQRLVFGDGKYDPYLYGIDDNTGLNELNLGNYGVLYRLKLNVAPRTLISLNPRGGHYSGAFAVNGRIVEVTKGSILKHQGEAVVLHRTGHYAETVELLFTPANGSNLPIALLFEPLPEERS